MYSTIYESVQSYASKGLAVFPCHSLRDGNCTCGKADCGSIAKHPKTANGFRDATTDPLKLLQYFGDGTANIGIATGSVSNIWVVDEDEPGAVDALQKQYGAFPATPIVETSSGRRHFYFRLPERVSIPNSASKIAKGIDVRGEGGYVVATPSAHRSGNAYRWLVSPDEVGFADAPEWLVELAVKPKQPQPATASKPMVVERARTEAERALLYLDQVPPAISGEGGHNHTFGVVCKIIECFPSLSDDEVLEVLDSWNERGVPPWSDAELRHKIADARKRVASSGALNARVASVNDSDYEDELPWPTLGADAYCGIVGEIVRAVEPHTEADNAGVIVTLLTCVGSAIGNGPRFNVGIGDSHSASLFACIVGGTASGKGQSSSIAKALMSSADPEWMRECIGYGLSSGEGLVERLADPDDAFSVAPQKRLCCFEGEFGRLITAMRRESNTLSHLMRSAWDGTTLEVMTRKSRIRASNAHLSLVGHITSEELADVLAKGTETSNGFANRFLWCLVRPSKSLSRGGKQVIIQPFADRLRFAIEFAKTVEYLERSPEADTLWDNVYRSLQYAICPVTERGRPIVCRIAMIYALLDCSPIIEVHHLRAAIAVWRYCEESAMRLFAGEEKPMVAKLRQLVYERPGIMRSELRHSLSHKTKTREFNSALELLVNRGDIVCVPTYEKRQIDRYFPGVRASGAIGDVVSSPVGEALSPTSPTSSLPPQTQTVGQETTSPVSPTSPLPQQTQVVTGDEFVADVSGYVQPATVADLLWWKNAHGARIIRRDCLYWVTNEDKLTPELRAAIHANQSLLSGFDIAEPLAAATQGGDLDEVDEDFVRELNEVDLSQPEKRLTVEHVNGEHVFTYK